MVFKKPSPQAGYVGISSDVETLHVGVLLEACVAREYKTAYKTIYKKAYSVSRIV